MTPDPIFSYGMSRVREGHMFRYAFAAFLVVVVASVTSHSQAPATNAPVTFSKDVLPILQKNCQSCHRPGQMAPMSLLTFRDARPWARSMKSKVESRQMPPWFADPAHGEFANDRSLAPRDIETIAKWADSGALEGDPKDAPPPVDWPADGWQIKPDIVVRGPEFRVPGAYAQRRRRVGDVPDSERVHQGHVDHVARNQAERDGRDASHLLHVRAAPPQCEVLRGQLVGVAARR